MRAPILLNRLKKTATLYRNNSHAQFLVIYFACAMRRELRNPIPFGEGMFQCPVHSCAFRKARTRKSGSSKANRRGNNPRGGICRHWNPANCNRQPARASGKEENDRQFEIRYRLCRKDFYRVPLRFASVRRENKPRRPVCEIPSGISARHGLRHCRARFSHACGRV